MSPVFPDDSSRRKQRFPKVEYFFKSGFEKWRGYSGSDNGRNESRRFRNLSREFLIEAARECTREMIVFGVVVVTAAWPVIYMAVTLIKLLSRESP